MINANMTTKEEDMISEQELAKYLDKYLYNRVSSKCKNIKRITDQKQQMDGIDVIIDYNNGSHVFIDEKAQLHYLDVCRKTFIFEINFIDRRNQLHLGWLFNHDLKTDTYMLIWPEKTIYHEIIKSIDDNDSQLNKIKDILRNIKCDDFEMVECYLIKREKIKNFLASYNWDEQRILEKAKILRKYEQYGRNYISETDSFYFYFSSPLNYRESPINIVIKKKELAKLAHKRYIVTKPQLFVN